MEISADEFKLQEEEEEKRKKKIDKEINEEFGDDED